MGTRLPSQNSFFHPEGPNIGPGSADNWFHKEGDLPPKTDLLHKGHSKGGKLVIVMVSVHCLAVLCSVACYRAPCTLMLSSLVALLLLLVVNAALDSSSIL
jgi:hypothetical protein